MMGRLNHDQGQLFYSFCLADAVPDDHPIREIAAVLDRAIQSSSQSAGESYHRRRFHTAWTRSGHGD
jgi:hypothetical protein